MSARTKRLCNLRNLRLYNDYIKLTTVLLTIVSVCPQYKPLSYISSFLHPIPYLKFRYIEDITKVAHLENHKNSNTNG